MAIDSLAQLDTGMFEFVIEATQDLNKAYPIQAPFSVSYCEKYSEEKK